MKSSSPSLSANTNTNTRATTTRTGTRARARMTIPFLVAVLGGFYLWGFVWTAHTVTVAQPHSQPYQLQQHVQPHQHSYLRPQDHPTASTSQSTSTQTLSPLLPASIWATRRLQGSTTGTTDGTPIRSQSHNHQQDLLVSSSSTSSSSSLSSLSVNLTSYLTQDEVTKIHDLCGTFYYSTLQKAAVATNMGQYVYVRTGDIDQMWIRDSVVQMSLYLPRDTTADAAAATSTSTPAAMQPQSRRWLRVLVEGAIRRNAFNIVQDPYANSYNTVWKDPVAGYPVKDKVIGRGGWVGTRNYELDSGAYFLHHLYDYYYMSNNVNNPNAAWYRPEALLQEPLILDAILLMVDTWIVEQHHDTQSPYRYFELPNQGKGSPTNYTGMIWSGFRPSDDPCQYHYLIPANIHTAGALERILLLNERIWQHDDLQNKARQLLQDITNGINTFGIVQNHITGERMYAYEVDGYGNVLANFDDANIPSLLSIPLLGWTGYDVNVYSHTREFLLSKQNTHYYEGSQFKGIGSPHTPRNYIWPMAMVVQGLTVTAAATASVVDDVGNQPQRDEALLFQLRQLLHSACHDAMHESVSQNDGCQFTRQWFEWANALFVIYVETVLGTDCSAVGNALYHQQLYQATQQEMTQHNGNSHFYSNRYGNKVSDVYFQDAQASVRFQ